MERNPLLSVTILIFGALYSCGDDGGANSFTKLDPNTATAQELCDASRVICESRTSITCESDFTQLLAAPNCKDEYLALFECYSTISGCAEVLSGKCDAENESAFACISN